MQQITKKNDNTYIIFQGKNSSILQTDKTINYRDSDNGFVVAVTKDSTVQRVSVSSIGVTKTYKFQSSRNVTYDIGTANTFTLNSTTFTAGKTHWFKGDDIAGECFVRLDDNNLTIDMATNGHYIINGCYCFSFENIDIVGNIQISDKFAKDSKYIYYDGKRYDLSESNEQSPFLLEKGSNRDVLKIKNNKFVQTEQMYIEFKNKTFMNIVMPTINPNNITFIKGRTYDIMNMDIFEKIRCVILRCEKKEKTIEFTIYRYSKNTENVSVNFREITEFQNTTEYLTIYSYHKKHKTFVDFKKFSNLDGFADVVDTVFQVEKPETKITIKFKNGLSMISTVLREDVKYTENTTEPYRYNIDEEIQMKSDRYYMINDVVYESSTDNVLFDGKNIILKPDTSIESVSTYNEVDKVWTVTPLYIKAFFDDTYDVVVFSNKNFIMNLNDCGIYDPKDKIEWLVGDKKNTTHGKYKLNVPKDILPGNTIESVKVTATINSKMVFNFEINFIFETFSKVQYLIKNDDIFGKLSDRKNSLSRSVDNNMYMFGCFLSPKDCTTAAYGMIVDSQNTLKHKKSYPIISFDSNNTASIIVQESNTYQIVTKILDTEFKLENVSTYVRLNNCNDVIFEGSTITVPSKTGVCFFRANDTLYLIKSNLTKSVSFGNKESILLSQSNDTVVEDTKILQMSSSSLKRSNSEKIDMSNSSSSPAPFVFPTETTVSNAFASLNTAAAAAAAAAAGGSSIFSDNTVVKKAQVIKIIKEQPNLHVHTAVTQSNANNFEKNKTVTIKNNNTQKIKHPTFFPPEARKQKTQNAFF